MDRIVATGTTPPPGTLYVADAHGVGKHGWLQGDPLVPTLGTIFTGEFMDGVQEEILYCIETAGLTPNAADNTQLYQSMLRLNNLQTAYAASALTAAPVYLSVTAGDPVTMDSDGAGAILKIGDLPGSGTGIMLEVGDVSTDGEGARFGKVQAYTDTTWAHVKNSASATACLRQNDAGESQLNGSTVSINSAGAGAVFDATSVLLTHETTILNGGLTIGNISSGGITVEGNVGDPGSIALGDADNSHRVTIAANLITTEDWQLTMPPASPVANSVPVVNSFGSAQWRQFDSGEYTPNVISNSSAMTVTPRICRWTRVGNTVFFTMGVLVSTTNTGDRVMALELPIPSAFNDANNDLHAAVSYGPIGPTGDKWVHRSATGTLTLGSTTVTFVAAAPTNGSNVVSVSGSYVIK